MIQFGEWLPDLADYQNPGATEAKNVIPTTEGYRQFNEFSRTSGALNVYCRGAFAAQSSARVSYNYAGTGTKLYQLSDATWTDQSKASGTYSVSDRDVWEFVKFGEKIITVGGINTGTPVPPQVITMGAVGATEFADLGGSPPQARHIAVIKDFVVMGNLYESTTLYPSRIRWSGVDDETTWTTDKAKQADYQDLPEGGWVQKVVGGDYGVIIQERGIVRMDYIGPPLVFSFNRVLPEFGTQAPNSVIQWGNYVFLYTQTGFKGIVNGTEPLDLSDNKITKWFAENIDLNYAWRIVGGLDRINNRLVWIFPDNNATEGTPNNGIIYDIASKKWSRFEDQLEWVYDSYGVTYTLDGLDSITTNLDNLGASLDDPVWISGIIGLGAFDHEHYGGRFSGDPATATIETNEQRLAEMNRTMINRIRSEIDGNGSTTINLNVGTRDSQEDSVVWSGNLTMERDDNFSIRSDARYHRFRAIITNGFTRAMGITVVEGRKSSVY